MSVFSTTNEEEKTDMRIQACQVFVVVCGDGLFPIILFALRLAETHKSYSTTMNSGTYFHTCFLYRLGVKLR